MAIRKMTLERWQKATAAAMDKPAELERLNGTSPGGVAAELGISRQAVHELMQRGRLDAVYVIDKRGKLLMILIPPSAVAEYLRTRRLTA